MSAFTSAKKISMMTAMVVTGASLLEESDSMFIQADPVAHRLRGAEPSSADTETCHCAMSIKHNNNAWTSFGIGGHINHKTLGNLNFGSIDFPVPEKPFNGLAEFKGIPLDSAKTLKCGDQSCPAGTQSDIESFFTVKPSKGSVTSRSNIQCVNIGPSFKPRYTCPDRSTYDVVFQDQNYISGSYDYTLSGDIELEMQTSPGTALKISSLRRCRKYDTHSVILDFPNSVPQGALDGPIEDFTNSLNKVVKYPDVTAPFSCLCGSTSCGYVTSLGRHGWACVKNVDLQAWENNFCPKN